MNLYLATDSYAAMKFTELALPGEYCFILDKRFSQKELDSVRKILKLGDEVKDVKGRHWDYVICSTQLCNKDLKGVKYKELCMIESGAFDYWFPVRKKLKNIVLYRKATLYALDPRKVNTAGWFKKVKRLKPNKLEGEASVEGVAAIVFTSPVQEDLGVNVNEQLRLWLHIRYSDRTVLIKPHPRDTYDYTVWGEDVLVDVSNVAAVVVDSAYKCDKVFVGPSTLAAISRKDGKSYLVYNDAMLPVIKPAMKCSCYNECTWVRLF